jgi:hypothetical protein
MRIQVVNACVSRLSLNSCIARKAGVATSAEPHLQHLWRGRERDGVVDSRGDTMMMLPATVVNADVSVVHPASSTYATGAAAVYGAAAAAQDQAKRVHYTRDVVGEAYALADMAASGRGVCNSAHLTSALWRLSIALCRGNSRMYWESLFTLTRASGRAF